ncbi:MAG: M23 family metallopeptidase [Oscillospiraceae bacterium]|nr:M23 family metallopeptidase [Oscillospiraceae bacterium]
MKNINFNKSKGLAFFTGKGFYIALAISLLAVGTAAYFAINRTMSTLTRDNNFGNNNIVYNDPYDWGNIADDVNKPQGGIGISETSDSDDEDDDDDDGTDENDNIQSNEEAPIAQNKWAMPLAGEVSVPFSNGELVRSKTLNDWRTHDGVDIKAELGTPVKSAADGKVLNVGEDPRWGMTVVIDHGEGYIGYYYNLDKNVTIKAGVDLKVGDTIGAVGMTALNEIAEDPHLHFAVKNAEKWIDPMSLMNG